MRSSSGSHRRPVRSDFAAVRSRKAGGGDNVPSKCPRKWSRQFFFHLDRKARRGPRVGNNGLHRKRRKLAKAICGLFESARGGRAGGPRCEKAAGGLRYS